MICGPPGMNVGRFRDLTLVRVRVTHAQDRGEDVPSSIIAEPVTASEESTWSARSVTSTNDVDADQR
jgi:hypothetical protein